MKQLVLATNNEHKIREIRSLLKALPLELLTLRDIPNFPPLVEDGETFQDNALRKAVTVFQHANLPALADDSGLEVFYLNMEPGVYSARYSGPNATDAQNNEKLLQAMRGVAPRRRRAQFRSVIAFVDKGVKELTEGIFSGTLAESPRGSNGFGYDPLFIPDGMTITSAELTDEEKNAISHRGQSLRKMIEVLRKRFG
ncbi:MAG TPA: RdgB/HAM1 family non-canonical purine NTP pyrophosphatase [Bacteroidota bacterium]|nr:RdgB/HAM1 family non-canonical purine NTP pyrophosphatase [Bacteroidota bacterium]